METLAECLATTVGTAPLRIEDLVAVRPDGSIENLTPFAYELEVGA